jgi:8-oxo-dGTP diphosphatase
MFSVPQCLGVSFRSVDSLTPTIAVVAAVVEEDDAFLVTRRPEGVHLAGLWEFPGGKIATAESHADALRREMREELDADVDVLDLVFETTHAYPERTVALFFYRCVLKQRPRPLLGQEMQWIKRSALSILGFPPADEELIRRLTTERPRSAQR